MLSLKSVFYIDPGLLPFGFSVTNGFLNFYENIFHGKVTSSLKAFPDLNCGTVSTCAVCSMPYQAYLSFCSPYQRGSSKQCDQLTPCMNESWRMKRIRGDGQVSRQEYDEDYDGAAQSQHPGSFSRATPRTLATRKFYSVQRGEKKIQFAKHVKTLNSSFHAWFGQQVRTDASADLLSGVQDYIDYISQIEGRYLRSYGEVLTFGSGDCG